MISTVKHDLIDNNDTSDKNIDILNSFTGGVHSIRKFATRQDLKHIVLHGEAGDAELVLQMPSTIQHLNNLKTTIGQFAPQNVINMDDLASSTNVCQTASF